MAGKATKDPIRGFLESKGVDTAVLDLDAPSVSSFTQDQESLFDFVGDDAAKLGEYFRFSQVNTDAQVQHLKARNFTIIADYRDGQKGACDVYPRGMGKQGVVMGRPKKIDAQYEAERRAEAYARRNRKKSPHTERHQGNDPRVSATVTTTTTNTPVNVRG